MLTYTSGLLYYILIGFYAQLIDGALGMSYGVISTSMLIYSGIPVVHASASVKFSEMFTTFISGIFHFKFGNVDKALFKKLVISGVTGGIIGAYILTSVPGDKIKPFVAVYLLIMGVIILLKGFTSYVQKHVTTKINILGFTGGFFDAIGGGGWGPIVTSTLIARGNNPHKSIGSVNASEFFVTVAQSAVFIIAVGVGFWKIILGLVIGGCIAAPFAAYICKVIPVKYLLILVGLMIVVVNIFNLL